MVMPWAEPRPHLRPVVRGHHERHLGRTGEWWTPPELFARLGLDFELDVAAPRGGVPWIPAARFLTVDDNGLTASWSGRVWCNPPYGPGTLRWVERMIAHGDGMLLLPARVETKAVQLALSNADVICFLRDRLHFIREDGGGRRATFASALFGWGVASSDAIVEADLGWKTR